MIPFLRRLFANPERHYPIEEFPGRDLVCKCGYHSPWDYNLNKHFEDMGRIGK